MAQLGAEAQSAAAPVEGAAAAGVAQGEDPSVAVLAAVQRAARAVVAQPAAQAEE